MHPRTRDALLGRGIPTDLVDKIDALGHTVASLEATPPSRLAADFSADELGVLRPRLGRQPIPPATLADLFDLSGRVCCYCADGLSGRPFQVHHVHGYADSRDHALDNLLLCCPTHHAAIHARGFDPVAQRRTRAEWYAVRRVANAYQRRGLPFPWTAFSSLCFDGVADPCTVLGPTPPSLPTVVEATQWRIRDEVVSTLRHEGFAIVAGASGSGKSTLARGVAGVLGAEEARPAYLHRPPRDDPRKALPELLTFLGVVTVPSLLVLDDANGWATVEDLEALRQAASEHVWVLATSSSEVDPRSSSRLQTHLGPSIRHLVWLDIQQPVLDYLEAHRDVIVPAVAAARIGDTGFRVGMGHLNSPLRVVAAEHARRAATLWQFSHMLCGGAWKATEDVRRHRHDRGDVPISHAAIEQIAGFEKTVDVAETTAAARAALAGSRPSPSHAWVTSVFERLREERRMDHVRDAWRPIHREWSIEWLDRALFLDQGAGATGALLRAVFSERAGDPTRIAFLWSWCWGHPTLRAWLTSYCRGLGDTDWQELLRHLSLDLHALAIVGRDLRTSFDGVQRANDWERALSACAGRIVAGMPAAAWRDRRELWSLTSGSAFGIEALHAVTPDHAAADLVASDPGEHSDVFWALAAARRIDAAWLVDVGRQLDVGALIGDRLDRCDPGDLESVFSPIQTLAELSLPVMRSTYRRLCDVAARVIAATNLRDLHAGGDPTLWLLARMAPAEMDRVARAFPVERVAEQLATADPVDWHRLAMVMHWFAPDGPSVAADVLDRVDFERFVGRIAELAPAHPYEFRLATWLLARSREPRRGQFASRLWAVACAVVKDHAGEHEGRSIVRAFGALDAGRGRDLSEATGVEPEPVSFEGLSPERYAAMRARVRVLDDAGDDYDLWSALAGVG